MGFPPHQKKVSKGLSLERFAGAKRSSYSKQHRVQRELALNAKKVNSYRKLKQRLLREGKLLQPSVVAQART